MNLVNKRTHRYNTQYKLRRYVNTNMWCKVTVLYVINQHKQHEQQNDVNINKRFIVHW